MRLTNFTTCAALALAAAAALPTAAAAQRPGEPTVCSAATAEVTTIAAIDSPNGPRAGDCVTIEGIRVGWELHTNNRSRYIQQTQYNTPSSTGAIIGLAGTPLSGTVSETAPHMVRITGRLETCATRRIRLGVGALVNPTVEQRMAFLSGFCEGTNGLLIDAVEEVVLGPTALIPVPADSAASGCTANVAQPMTIAEIVAAGDGTIGRCISVEGLPYAAALHADNSARYRQELRVNDPSSTGAIIGLIGDFVTNPTHRARIVGRVDSCTAIRARQRANDARRSENGDITVSTDDGFCGRNIGLVIEATQYTELSPAPLTRMIRSGAGPDLGNLVPLADPELRRLMMQLGAHFVLAVEHRDRDALITLLRPLGENPRTDADAAALADEVLAADSPFAAFTPGAEPLIEVFGWREPIWNEAEYELRLDPSHPREAVVCMSVHPDGAVLLPIDTRDADNQPGRPYACTRIMVRSDNLVSFDPARHVGGAAEPDYCAQD